MQQFVHVYFLVFNYVCETGCSPEEMPRCWYEGSLIALCLSDREFDQFCGRFFFLVSFYKMTESVTRQIRD